MQGKSSYDFCFRCKGLSCPQNCAIQSLYRLGWNEQVNLHAEIVDRLRIISFHTVFTILIHKRCLYRIGLQDWNAREFPIKRTNKNGSINDNSSIIGLWNVTGATLKVYWYNMDFDGNIYTPKMFQSTWEISFIIFHGNHVKQF